MSPNTEPAIFPEFPDDDNDEVYHNIATSITWNQNQDASDRPGSPSLLDIWRHSPGNRDHNDVTKMHTDVGQYDQSSIQRFPSFADDEDDEVCNTSLNPTAEQRVNPFYQGNEDLIHFPDFNDDESERAFATPAELQLKGDSAPGYQIAVTKNLDEVTKKLGVLENQDSSDHETKELSVEEAKVLMRNAAPPRVPDSVNPRSNVMHLRSVLT